MVYSAFILHLVCKMTPLRAVVYRFSLDTTLLLPVASPALFCKISILFCIYPAYLNL